MRLRSRYERRPAAILWSALRGAAVLAVFLASPGSARADDCADAQDLYRRGFYEEYIDAMKAAGEHGAAECLFRVGTVYRDGILTRQDLGTALAWFRLAAARDHPFAQFELGTMYDLGQGVPQDYLEAVRWYRRAANQGFQMAQHNLAVMYEEGLGVPRDPAGAALLYRMSTRRSSDAF